MLPFRGTSCGGQNLGRWGAGTVLGDGAAIKGGTGTGLGLESRVGLGKQGGTPLPVYGTGAMTLGIPNFQVGAPSRHPGVFWGILVHFGASQLTVPPPTGLRCGSALFRHEIGYVLGQLQDEACVPQLTATLRSRAENPMVRHECAEALGSIARPSCLRALRAFAGDEERVVRESCQVALDMYEYENSSQFQYADRLCKLQASS